MAAASFSPDTYCLGTAETIDHRWLALVVGVGSFLFLAVTMLLSLLDAKLTARHATLEAQSERFFNQSLNLICLCGPAGRFLRLNPTCSRTLGYPRDKMLALRFIDLVRPDDRPAVTRRSSSCARPSQPASPTTSPCWTCRCPRWTA